MIVFGLLSPVSGILTFSPSAWDSTPAPPCPVAAGSSNRPAPNSPSCSSCAPAKPLPKPPGPAAGIHRHRRHNYHPARQPAGRTTRPHRRPRLGQGGWVKAASREGSLRAGPMCSRRSGWRCSGRRSGWTGCANHVCGEVPRTACRRTVVLVVDAYGCCVDQEWR